MHYHPPSKNIGGMRPPGMYALVSTLKYRFIDVIMTSFLQKIFNIFFT